jgi:hypothetical protein
VQIAVFFGIDAKRNPQKFPQADNEKSAYFSMVDRRARMRIVQCKFKQMRCSGMTFQEHDYGHKKAAASVSRGCRL